MRAGLPAALFVAGLLLRLGGLFFNGMVDLDEMLLDWGAAVARYGLADAFGINYGVFSYAAFGLATAGADLMPRFWWAPYKLLVLGFDLGVLAALRQLVPRRAWTVVLVLYWVNPWFVLHEAYHGFWEAPHVLMGLTAVLALRRLRAAASGIAAWTVVGIALACSAMFKPQGLIYFVGPVGLVLLAMTFRGRARPLAALLAGIASVVLAVSLWFWAAGGPPLAVVDNYRSALTVMPAASNGGPGLWRFVTFVYMVVTGETGHVATARMPGLMLAVISEVAALLCLALIAALAVAIRRARSRQADVALAPETLLLTLAFGALVMSQFGVRAHINHTYTALVLLMPLAASPGAVQKLWVAMAALLGVSHVLIYGLGRPALLPPDAAARYPAALIAAIEDQALDPALGGLLDVQAGISRLLSAIPAEMIVSLLSVPVFVVACLLVRALLRKAGTAA